jgi:hypothetical protein
MTTPTGREQRAAHHESRRKVLHATKPRPQKSKAREVSAPAAAPTATAAERQAMIEEAAYFRAERRAFEPGYELDDWLYAERDIERALAPSSDEDPTLCGD